RRHRRRCLRVANLELGLEHALAPVLEDDVTFDARALGAAIKRVDERIEALADDAPAHLARPRQLAVVRVELFMEDEEAAELRAGEMRLGCEIAVHLLDAPPNEIVDAIEARQLLIAAIGCRCARPSCRPLRDRY